MKLSELKEGEAALVRHPGQYGAYNNKGDIIGYCGFRKEDIDSLEERLKDKDYVLLRDVVIY